MAWLRGCEQIFVTPGHSHGSAHACADRVVAHHFVVFCSEESLSCMLLLQPSSDLWIGHTSGRKQETCNFPYGSGTGGVQVNFTDIVQILKKHCNPKRFEIAPNFNCS